MTDPFHEAKQALRSAEIEFTTTGSLSLYAAGGPVHACELALRELYSLATGTQFPHDRFKPHHQPERLAESLGIKGFFSKDSQRFLNQLVGHALQDARYEGSQAFIDYTTRTSSGFAADLIRGSNRFLQETQVLASDQSVLDEIKNNAR